MCPTETILKLQFTYFVSKIEYNSQMYNRERERERRIERRTIGDFVCVSFCQFGCVCVCVGEMQMAKVANGKWQMENGILWILSSLAVGGIRCRVDADVCKEGG